MGRQRANEFDGKFSTFVSKKERCYTNTITYASKHIPATAVNVILVVRTARGSQVFIHNNDNVLISLRRLAKWTHVSIATTFNVPFAGKSCSWRLCVGVEPCLARLWQLSTVLYTFLAMLGQP